MNRRSFLGLGLKSVVLATAISTGLGRTALEVIKPKAQNHLLSIDMITREALRVFEEKLMFLDIVNLEPVNTASTLRIRRPNQFTGVT